MIHLDPRLYVEIVPFAGPRSPRPHPVEDGGFDTDLIYKCLGIYTPSETGEAYVILSNPGREIWFISNRHLRAYALLDSDALCLPKRKTTTGAA